MACWCATVEIWEYLAPPLSKRLVNVYMHYYLYSHICIPLFFLTLVLVGSLCFSSLQNVSSALVRAMASPAVWLLIVPLRHASTLFTSLENAALNAKTVRKQEKNTLQFKQQSHFVLLLCYSLHVITPSKCVWCSIFSAAVILNRL